MPIPIPLSPPNMGFFLSQELRLHFDLSLRVAVRVTSGLVYEELFDLLKATRLTTRSRTPLCSCWSFGAAAELGPQVHCKEDIIG